MFAVVIPLYNKQAYVERAIASVKAQACTAFEAIVVDDGSTDDSLRVARRAAADDVRFRFVSQRNAGVSAARNSGIRHASMPWVAFLDADDEWLPRHLEQLRHAISRDPTLALVASSFLGCRNGTRSAATDFGFPVGAEVVRNFDFFAVWSRHGGSPIFTSATAVRTDVLREIGGFDESVSLGEDLLVWMQVVRSHPYAFVNNSQVLYHQDDEVHSLTRRPTPKSIRSHLRLLVALEEAVQAGRCPPSLLDHFRDVHLHMLVRGGARSSALGYMMQHRRLWSTRQWGSAIASLLGVYEPLRGLRR
jgi:glycosyltransferase involved in cell wall biosynthesis